MPSQVPLDLSVIVPTYGRPEMLGRCLASLAGQCTAARYEILVIDDGSASPTADVVNQVSRTCRAPLRFFAEAHRGPAAARNRGIEEARGQVLLFLGDDILPALPSFLDEHWVSHSTRYPSQNVAVLGYTTWSPELPISQYMRWLESGGAQFSYDKIRDGDAMDCRFFYTSNVSLKASFLGAERFDERFRHAALEDMELGYRLQQRGLKLMVNKSAAAYHHHQVTFDGYCQRALLAGQSAALLDTLHPHFFEHVAVPRWKRAARRLGTNALTRGLLLGVMRLAEPSLRSLGRFFEHRHAVGWLFTTLYRYYWWRGYDVEQGTMH